MRALGIVGLFWHMLANPRNHLTGGRKMLIDTR